MALIAGSQHKFTAYITDVYVDPSTDPATTVRQAIDLDDYNTRLLIWMIRSDDSTPTTPDLDVGITPDPDQVANKGFGSYVLQEGDLTVSGVTHSPRTAFVRVKLTHKVNGTVVYSGRVKLRVENPEVIAS